MRYVGDRTDVFPALGLTRSWGTTVEVRKGGALGSFRLIHIKIMRCKDRYLCVRATTHWRHSGRSDVGWRGYPVPERAAGGSSCSGLFPHAAAFQAGSP